MGLRAGLDWCGKSRPTGIRSPNRPARRQLLYRLRYPAHCLHVLLSIMMIVFLLFAFIRAELLCVSYISISLCVVAF